MQVDGAPSSACEEELRGVSIQIELVVGGNDFESVVDDVLTEDGRPGLLVGIAVPAMSWVHPWHGAIGHWGLRFFAFLVKQYQVEGWD
jgi:hypothetical protein